MKIALGVLAALFLLILVVLVVGWLLPKGHSVSRSASFRATPERLFALISGPQDWRPDVKSTEILAQPGGRVMMRETTRDGETVTYELLDSAPPNSLTRRIATPNLPYSGSWTYALQSSGPVTQLRITETGEVYNPIYRFVSRFVIGQTRTIDNYLRALGKATDQTVEIHD